MIRRLEGTRFEPMWPLIALVTVAATSGTTVPCVAPIDCASEVNATVCDENERFCRDDSSTWSADDGSGNCAWVAEDPEARCPLPGSEAVLGCAGGEEAGDAGCDYELVFEAARAFETVSAHGCPRAYVASSGACGPNAPTQVREVLRRVPLRRVPRAEIEIKEEKLVPPRPL